MPLSQTAFAALKAAANWNFFGATELLAILREHPGLVRHKDDECGPLGFILIATEPRKQLPDGSLVLVRTDPFPVDLLHSCREFARKWREHQFSKSELAEALQKILDEENASQTGRSLNHSKT
jgi:hypothetical protein